MWEPGWQLCEVSGGRLGETREVFCPMENTSMFVWNLSSPTLVTPFQHMSWVGLGALDVAQEEEEERRGCVWVSEVQVKAGGWVAVPSQPPQGQNSHSGRQRAGSCSICVTAEPITEGSRFSGWASEAWLSSRDLQRLLCNPQMWTFPPPTQQWLKTLFFSYYFIFIYFIFIYLWLGQAEMRNKWSPRGSSALHPWHHSWVSTPAQGTSNLTAHTTVSSLPKQEQKKGTEDETLNVNPVFFNTSLAQLKNSQAWSLLS